VTVSVSTHGVGSVTVCVAVVSEADRPVVDAPVALAIGTAT